MRVGLREANQFFSKYMKMVKKGKELIVTDRGKPVAIIKPLLKEDVSPESRLKLLEEQGLLRRAVKGILPLRKLVTIEGKPISEIVIEEREDRF